MVGMVHAQEQYPAVPSLEFGVTSMVVDLAFPGFDIDFAYPFFSKGVNSLAFKNPWFISIRGNAFYKPMFTQFGPIAELQYRVITKNGFFFAAETGLGMIGEFFPSKMYKAGKGFEYYPGIPYGIFSAGIRVGGDCMPVFSVPIRVALMFGYRIQFPYNLTYNDFYIFGISLSYTFDLRKK